jgi:5-amino-6-(5-phosphoribosylamino)uracil reductase/diaminohydroxyphosphoribosylaminopyrimidine deaminase/5-amino-6-(5-phosphoribosylamino)uracil reductase
MNHARPAITISYAQTLDGRIATRDGQSQWISGSESLVFAHQLRAQHDAIMVGVGTVLQDNPRLTVRLAQGRDPLRVVVDSMLRTPLDAAVLADGAASRTIIATTDRAPAERIEGVRALGAAVLVLPATNTAQVDLHALLDALRDRGIASIMVEGGARLITALLRQQLVNRIAVCVAPKILGAGLDAVGDLHIRALRNMITLRDVQIQQYGADFILTGDVMYSTDQHAHDQR